MSSNSNQQQIGRLLAGLLEGHSPLVRHRTRQGNRLEVRLLSARSASVYNQYQAYIAELLPVNFKQVKPARVGFPDSGAALSGVARAELNIILQLFKTDPSINQIKFGGYSDNSDNRLTNRNLSHRRVLAVQEYLKSSGVPKSRINVCFYGKRYSLVANSSAVSRARNRRVTMRLSREATTKPTTETPKAEGRPAPPVAEFATPKPPTASLRGKPTI